MYELHENEQYFFDPLTLQRLTEFISTGPFRKVCCLCCPLLGQKLVESNIPVDILDIDKRFAGVPGFREYDIYRPTWLGENYDLIVCDPPFFKVSLSKLFAAIRLLSDHDFNQPILLCYLARRAPNVVGTFSRFGLRPSGLPVGYQTVQSTARNEIEFFSNLPDDMLQPLKPK